MRILFLLFLSYLSFLNAQGRYEHSIYDTLYFKVGRFITGELKLMNENTLDFYNAEDGITYEIKKGVVDNIQLGDGRILNFYTVKNEVYGNNSKVGLTFSFGYGMLNMGEINNHLRDTYQFFKPANVPERSPKELKGGLLYEGNITIKFSSLFLGLSVNYISAEGSLLISDHTGYLEERYDVGTTELSGIVGGIIPLSRFISFCIKGYAGYGMLRINHLGIYDMFSSPGSNAKITNNISGKIFTTRLQGGFDISIYRFILNLSAAYRSANAGVLKGDYTRNGQKYSDMGIKNSQGKDISFDFSGIMFLSGIQLQL